MVVRGKEEDVFVEEKSAGQTVGWSAMVAALPLHSFCLAPLETEVIVLPREALGAFCEHSPEAGYKICLNLAVLVGQRLQLVQAMWMREMQRTVVATEDRRMQPQKE